MPQELHFIHPKLTLRQFDVQLLLSQYAQHYPQMFKMFFMRS